MINQTPIKVEACTGSVQSCIEAQAGGAHRVELCDNLFEGGTTPSIACIEQSCKLLQIPVFVMIRPRGGDFLYSDIEFETMLMDCRYAAQAGAAGVAAGILNADGTIDCVRTKQLIDLSKGLNMGFTFHRAFDMSNDPMKALEDLIAIGCDRILTSGGENTAVEGQDLIAKLVKKAAGRMIIMAGSGVKPHNALDLIRHTGIQEIHMSGKGLINGGMMYKNHKIKMGGLAGIPEYEIVQTDANTVRQVVESLNQSVC